MSPRFARFILFKVMGWTIAEGEDKKSQERNVIFLAAPHTSIFDFVIGYLYFRAVDDKPRIMIKKEAFKFPLGPILRSLGGFPIDRGNSQKMIMGIIHEMQESEQFHLTICPEGTRKAIKRWKTGYHTIALGTGASVYLGFYDYKKKICGHGPKFELSSDARSDTDRIQKIYEEMHLTAKYPSDFLTH